MVVMMVLALGLNLLEKASPEAVYTVFARPAAFLTAWFFGAHPVLTGPREITIPLARQAIQVIPACSAYGFFCLLYAMSVVGLFRRLSLGKALAASLLALPVAYAVTLLTNSARMVCAYYVRLAGRVLLPDNFQAAAHLGVGVIVFLSVLMGAYLLLERTLSDARH